jgi:hypothetical protein
MQYYTRVGSFVYKWFLGCFWCCPALAARLVAVSKISHPDEKSSSLLFVLVLPSLSLSLRLYFLFASMLPLLKCNPRHDSFFVCCAVRRTGEYLSCEFAMVTHRVFVFPFYSQFLSLFAVVFGCFSALFFVGFFPIRPDVRLCVQPSQRPTVTPPPTYSAQPSAPCYNEQNATTIEIYNSF